MSPRLALSSFPMTSTPHTHSPMNSPEHAPSSTAPPVFDELPCSSQADDPPCVTRVCTPTHSAASASDLLLHAHHHLSLTQPRPQHVTASEGGAGGGFGSAQAPSRRPLSLSAASQLLSSTTSSSTAASSSCLHIRCLDDASMPSPNNSPRAAARAAHVAIRESLQGTTPTAAFTAVAAAAAAAAARPEAGGARSSSADHDPWGLRHLPEVASDPLPSPGKDTTATVAGGATTADATSATSRLPSIAGMAAAGELLQVEVSLMMSRLRRSPPALLHASGLELLHSPLYPSHPLPLHPAVLSAPINRLTSTGMPSTNAGASAAGPSSSSERMQPFLAYLHAEATPQEKLPTTDVVWGQTERERV